MIRGKYVHFYILIICTGAAFIKRDNYIIIKEIIVSIKKIINITEYY